MKKLILLAFLAFANNTLPEVTILYDYPEDGSLGRMPGKTALFLSGSYKVIATLYKVGGIHEPIKDRSCSMTKVHIYQRLNVDALSKYLVISRTTCDCHIDCGSCGAYDSLEEIAEAYKDNFEFVIEKF